jgi:hypothetical protein
MKQTNTSNNQDEKQFDWAAKLEDIAGGVIKGVMGGLVERIKERMHELFVSFQKNLAGSFLLLVGFIFVFIGLAIFINDLVKISNGIGYALVGIVALLTGLIIIKK